MERGKPVIAVLGAGLAGCCAALELSRRGHRVTLVDKAPRPMMGASRHNEGKLHLGYVYAADRGMQTAQILMQGSLRFFEVIETLTGVTETAFRRSEPFTYIVPHGSQLGPSEIAEHLAHVDDELQALHTEWGRPLLPRAGELERAAWSQTYANIDAAFHTPEIAVDPQHAAGVVAAAVLADPAIDFIGDHRVRNADRSGDAHTIDLDGPGASRSIRCHGVINSLWEDRVFIDETAGVTTTLPWMWRFRFTVSIDGDIGDVVGPTTAVLGPFGDVVPFGAHRTYLSWYPAGNIALTNEKGPDPLRRAASQADFAQILEGSIAGQITHIPAIATVSDLRERALVHGAYIVALGTSDIDDAASMLHERHQIGPRSHGSWVSLETGKYCTAPIFGVEAAEMLCAVLNDQ